MLPSRTLCYEAEPTPGAHPTHPRNQKTCLWSKKNQVTQASKPNHGATPRITQPQTWQGGGSGRKGLKREGIHLSWLQMAPLATQKHGQPSKASASGAPATQWVSGTKHHGHMPGWSAGCKEAACQELESNPHGPVPLPTPVRAQSAKQARGGAASLASQLLSDLEVALAPVQDQDQEGGRKHFQVPARSPFARGKAPSPPAAPSRPAQVSSLGPASST